MVAFSRDISGFPCSVVPALGPLPVVCPSTQQAYAILRITWSEGVNRDPRHAGFGQTGNRPRYWPTCEVRSGPRRAALPVRSGA